MTLAAWVHNIDPFIFKITDSLGPRWYGFAYAMGFVVGYFLLRTLSKRGVSRIPANRVGDAIIIIALGVIVGGRLGYAAFYRPDLIWTFSGSFPWWNLLDLTEGGMASHGGLVGVIFAAAFVSRGHLDESGRRIGRVPLLHTLDLLCLLAPFGLLFGRLANFVNGELLGKVVADPGETAPWWTVRFPQEISGLSDGTISIQHLTPNQQVGLWELVRPYMAISDTPAEAYGRVVKQVQSGSGEIAAQLGQYLHARHPSQLYQALAEGILVGAVVWIVARKPRLPGVVGCWFLISYGLLRIVTEVWRLPDAHFEVGRPFGLSRGQWLSATMVVMGIAILFVLVRRGGNRMGGWLAPAAPEPSNQERDDESPGAKPQ